MQRLLGRSGGNRGPPEASRRTRTQAARARPSDPFGIDATLFDYLTHVEQHGEAFAGYRAKGHPMVLMSLVDGTALASIHIFMSGDRDGRAMIARQPGNNVAFQGVLTAEGQSFEIVMMNLTTDGVLMLDIGGDLRHMEAAYWDRSDKEFWSGRHRNDRRLNRSNILWPMTPNRCEENNLHYQETGVSRRLQLLTQTSMTADGISMQGGDRAAGFPIFVYPKHGSSVSSRFERTRWACPETIVVAGSPHLLGDSSVDYNIQRDNPLNRRGQPAQTGVVGALADTLGVTSARLLEVAEVDPEFLGQIPVEMAHDILMQQLDEKKIRALMAEGGDDDKGAQRVSSMPSYLASGSPTASAPMGRSSSTSASQSAAASATPAAVVAGERLLSSGGHNLLIEKFDFGKCSQSAMLCFGVYERLQHSDDTLSEDEISGLREELHTKISELSSGRREALLEQICAVYDTPDCVICMSAGPDTVLYQCGHRCVHFRCIERSGLRRCPLCRAPIAAMLPDAPRSTSTSI